MVKKTAYLEPKSEAGKPIESAVRLGQVFTPKHIADQMVSDLLSLGALQKGTTILDPCIGKAVLPQAILRAGCRDIELIAYELDLSLADEADLWIQKHLSGNSPVRRGDFLLTRPSDNGYDAAIANPPYIRQEWIDKKRDYQRIAAEKWQADIPGTSNLYAYFIVKIIKSLKPGGVFSVIIYDSWAQTKYGIWLTDFLNSECESLSSTPVLGAPFEGRLIDATIISGYRSGFDSDKSMTLEYPTRGQFHDLEGFVPISEEYWSKRGLRLKQASFFIAGASDIADHGATRFAKKPAKVTGLCIPSNHPESAFLLPLVGDPDPRVIAALEARLEIAQKQPDSNQSILNWYRNRPDYWHRHPEAPKAPILFNYYFRKRPRHLFNPTLVHYADNYYGIVPENGMPIAASFALLNSTAVALELDSHSRSQGSGLNKLQLYEYRKAHIPSGKLFSDTELNELVELGQQMVSDGEIRDTTIRAIDSVVFRASGQCEKLDPDVLSGQANLTWGSR